MSKNRVYQICSFGDEFLSLNSAKKMLLYALSQKEHAFRPFKDEQGIYIKSHIPTIGCGIEKQQRHYITAEGIKTINLKIN